MVLSKFSSIILNAHLQLFERQPGEGMGHNFVIKGIQAHDLSLRKPNPLSSPEPPAEDKIGHTPGQVKTLGRLE